MRKSSSKSELIKMSLKPLLCGHFIENGIELGRGGVLSPAPPN